MICSSIYMFSTLSHQAHGHFFCASSQSSMYCASLSLSRVVNLWFWIVLGVVMTIATVHANRTQMCTSLRDNTVKIRAIGLIYSDTLAIVTTSGHLLQMKLKSSLRQANNSTGHYYLNLSAAAAEPIMVKDKWPNYSLDLGESNAHKLMYFVLNQRTVAYLVTVHRQNTQNATPCVMLLDFNMTKSDGRIMNQCNTNLAYHTNITSHFYISDANFANADEFYGFGFRCEKEQIHRDEYLFTNSYDDKFHIFQNSTFTTESKKDFGTPLSGFLLHEPYNLLVFIYSDGSVEQRVLSNYTDFWHNNGPKTKWTISPKQFIHCDVSMNEIDGFGPIYVAVGVATVSVILLVVASIVLYRKFANKQFENQLPEKKSTTTTTKLASPSSSPKSTMSPSSSIESKVVSKLSSVVSAFKSPVLRVSALFSRRVNDKAKKKKNKKQSKQ